ncbi:MAG: hypothetical protein CL920_37305 [Deltaproteobacteria bacterium]|nr:hypothetical protein [Deltaproteobacteria bacterium]MBU54390.1 hypothetical protein [Deltaproteobacteria bacterium]|tara:strand:+ start:433 stop:1692 length:1260 start_codon:yes stop_codon:yes gene_type:complete
MNNQLSDDLIVNNLFTVAQRFLPEQAPRDWWWLIRNFHHHLHQLPRLYDFDEEYTSEGCYKLLEEVIFQGVELQDVELQDVELVDSKVASLKKLFLDVYNSDVITPETGRNLFLSLSDNMLRHLTGLRDSFLQKSEMNNALFLPETLCKTNKLGELVELERIESFYSYLRGGGVAEAVIDLLIHNLRLITREMYDEALVYISDAIRNFVGGDDYAIQVKCKQNESGSYILPQLNLHREPSCILFYPGAQQQEHDEFYKNMEFVVNNKIKLVRLDDAAYAATQLKEDMLMLRHQGYGLSNYMICLVGISYYAIERLIHIYPSVDIKAYYRIPTVDEILDIELLEELEDRMRNDNCHRGWFNFKAVLTALWCKVPDNFVGILKRSGATSNGQSINKCHGETPEWIIDDLNRFLPPYYDNPS